MEDSRTWPNTPEAELPAVADAVLSTLTAAAKEAASATVLALEGDLGAGKTTFTKVLATTLGVAETVTSPTFVIMKQYQTTHPTFSTLVHIDAYRIEAEAELTVLSWEAICSSSNTLILLEWPSRVAGLLPDNHYTLSFTSAGENRDITLTYGS